MLKIRFVRVGRKHAPTYRLVVVDSRRATRSGACLEILGNYNPTQKTFNLKEESIREWISKGAQVSDTAHNLLVKNKVIKGKKINVSKVRKKKKGEEKEKTEEKTEASPASPEAGVEKEVETEQPVQEEKTQEPAVEEKAEKETGDKKDEKVEEKAEADAEKEKPKKEEVEKQKEEKKQ